MDGVDTTGARKEPSAFPSLERDAASVYRYVKPAIDHFAATILMLLFSWLFLLILIVYLVTLQFPVFFIHKRIGKEEKVFSMIKFRTLKPSGNSLEERRFRWGDFLRFTSLDELPQLLNVLKGDMSLIGPRALPVDYLPLFSPAQRLRHAVKPGITGLAQVNGRHSIAWEKKFDFDLHYVNHVSCWLDFKILVKTILLILSFKKDTSLQESKFTGK